LSARVVDKEAKRRAILHAAMRLVARKGIRNVRMSDIARAAGVGKGTVYEYFSGKKEIYAAIIREYLDRAEIMAVRKMFRAHTPRDKITALLTGWMESVENESEDLMMLFIDVWSEAIRRTGPEDGDIFDLRSFFQDYREYVVSILQEGIDAGELRPVNTTVAAGSLLALCDGIMLQWLLDRESLDVKETVNTMIDIVWNGIALKEA
jgi:AcrR family transcriptional regulator